ncbi:MAG: hypothetical protein M3011_09815 [Actinomycetota bacterium]|nr:hypothetical protein [Actinomycetota bacterium]
MLVAVATFALLAAVLVVAGIVNIGDNRAGGVTLLVFGAVALALAEQMRRMARPDPSNPLTILRWVSKDAPPRGAGKGGLER